MSACLPVLTFHHIDDSPSVISFPREVFRKGIRKLHERGYQAFSLSEAADFLHRGDSFPDRSFVLTFDDGYQSVYKEVFPILNRYGMRATIFLTVGKRETAVMGENRLSSLDGRVMLSWGEIREMQRAGFEFGAHTLTHADLTRLPLNQAKSEIFDSKEIIEQALNARVSSFSYPYGHYNDHIREMVQEHFDCACSDRLGMISHKSDIYALERVETYYFRTDRLFHIMLTRLFPWYLLARSIPRQFRRYLLTISTGRKDEYHGA